MASPARDVLEELRELGNAHAKRTFAKHGASGAMFGVRFADLDALAKRHRGDQPTRGSWP